MRLRGLVETYSIEGSVVLAVDLWIIPKAKTRHVQQTISTGKSSDGNVPLKHFYTCPK